MAIIRKLEQIQLDRDSKHSEMDCTYSVVEDGGDKYLWVDTNATTSKNRYSINSPVWFGSPLS